MEVCIHTTKQRFDGKITDFRFYDTALSRGEVEHLHRGLHKNIDSLIKPALHLPLNSSNPASNVLTTAGNKLKHSILFEPDNYQDRTGNSTVELHSNSFLKGSTADGMRFPSGSIPSNFTMVTVARHPVGGEDGRIFDATTQIGHTDLQIMLLEVLIMMAGRPITQLTEEFQMVNG